MAGVETSDRTPFALRIHLLGEFRVWGGTRLVEPPAWRRRRAARIVQLLALAAGHQIRREQLIEQLWPEDRPEGAANRFNQTLYFARRAGA